MREIKICHLSDLHVQEGDRFDETMDKLHQVSDEANAAGCRTAIVTGDLYDNLGRPSTPKERNALAQVLGSFGMPVYVVKGNHDHPGDLEIFDQLRGVVVAERPLCQLVTDEMHGTAFDLLLIPYPDRRWLNCSTEHPLNTTAGRQVVRDHLRELLKPPKLARVIPLVVAAHLNVTGCVASSGQPLIGQDVEVALGDLLDAQPNAVLLGHIHKHQALAPEVVYAGSLVPHDYGEQEPKGWVEWSIQQAMMPAAHGDAAGPRPEGNAWDTRWTFHDVGATKRILVNIELDSEGVVIGDDVPERHEMAGQRVRVRVRVPEAIRPDVDVTSLVDSYVLKGTTTKELRIERVTIPLVTTRNERIERAESLAAKLGIYLADQEHLDHAAIDKLLHDLNDLQAAGATADGIANVIIAKEADHADL